MKKTEKFKTKKIWLVSPYISIDAKNSRQRIIAGYLEQEGYKAYIITANTDKKYNPNNRPYVMKKRHGVKYMLMNIEVGSLSGAKRVLAQIKFQKMVLQYCLRIGKPDLIISNFAGIFGERIFYYKRRYGTKILLDILDFWPQALVEQGYLQEKSLITKFLYLRERASYKKADSIFFSMPGGKDYIKDKGWNKKYEGNIELNKVHYMNNGINIADVDANREQYVLEDADLDSDKFKVGYIGTIGNPNNLDLVVEAARLAQDRGQTNILFLIYGNGQKLEEVKQLSEKYGLENIKFKGRLDICYFPGVINRCNLALLNFCEIQSLRYGLSNNKFFMYCASGMPVLSTVHPRYSIIEKEQCGLIVDHTPAGILDGIERFKNMDASEYRMYQQNARKVGEKYDYGKIIQPMMDEVKRLIGE